MSYAVHDSQPAQNWNDTTMYNSKKRKRPVATANETTTSAKTLPNNKRLNSAPSTSNDNTTTAHFLIDGTVPVKPSPQLLAQKTEVPRNTGPGRHRSVDLKGLIMELIDEIYPPLVCPTCYHISSGRSEADAHFKNEHHGFKVFECMHTKCDQAYSSKPGLRYHLEHAHQVTMVSDNKKASKSKNNTAKSTTATTTSKAKINTSSSNTSERLRKQELSAHLQKKLDEIYDATICPSCNEQFKRKTHVIKHLVDEHHGEEPYKCVVAGCTRTKSYATREGLVYHLVSYHDEMQQ